MQIDLKEAARLFNISEREMLRWVEQRKAPVHRAQENPLFNRAELAEWARENGIQMEQQLASNDGGPIHEALSAGGITRLEGGSGRDEVIRELAAKLPLPDKVSTGEIAEMLIAREKQMSTGLGDGLAIPHVRTPLVLNTEAPLLNLCLLDKPIDFSSPDKKPVYALFTIIAPNARLHLEMLSRLAGIISARTVKAALEKRASDKEILAAIAAVEANRTAK